MTIEEISQKTGKSQKSIRRHVLAGTLKAERINNKWNIEESEFERWVSSGDCNEKDSPEMFAKATVKSEKDDIINWIDVKKECTQKKYNGWSGKYRNGYNFIDLFSGAGGMSCGYVQAGFTPIASVEIMEAAVETYKYNFIENKKFKETVETRDITKPETKQALYDLVGDQHVNLIHFSAPCQGFSTSGGRIVCDPRNSLYLHALEIINHIKPDFFTAENVEGMRTMLDGGIEAKIIEDFKAIGYEINVTILNAADYGVAQTRRRLIFVGNRVGMKNYHPEPFVAPENYKTIGQEISRFMNIPEDKSINHIITRHDPEMAKRIAAVPEGESLYKGYSDAWKKCAWDKPSCTVKENHGGVNLHPRLPRVMTPRELAALQSFPDDFIFKGGKKWQLVQIGNAVPPGLARAIGVAVKKGLDEYYDK